MTTPPSTGFMVLHSNRLEGLRDLMVSFMQRQPLPPLAPEVLLVQSNGMKHWLEMSLAERLGVCAATRIELPSTMLWQIYRQVLGADRVRARMPLDKAPLVWRLMRMLPPLMQQPHFAPLARYLHTAQGGDLRLYQLAQQLADVFDGYQNYRADWLDDWAQPHSDNQRPLLRDARGHTHPLPEEHAWQAPLWSAVMNDLKQGATKAYESTANESAAYESRAQVHQAFLQALRDWPEGQPVPGLPPRLMVFGVTSLPMQSVEALAALGRVCQVLLWVHNPCQYHWGHVVPARVPLAQALRRRQALRPGLPAPDAPGIDSADAQFQLHTDSHPLLAAWGKHGRDYLHLLDAFDDVARYRHRFDRVDLFIDPVNEAAEQARAPTQLEQLQSAVLRLEPLPAEPVALDPHDTSISLHMHYSAQREVEVLHDQLLAWLDADPQLQASDVMVMVPDMAQFAPHIHAVFGRFARGEARHLPYTVADTGTQEEPVVQALTQLLQLPQLRITRAEWQAWFEVDALRQRFGLQADDVARMAEWLDAAAVRWGLDAPHRRPWGMDADQPDAHQNTWLFGLQRLLLGYAHGNDAPEGDDVWHHIWRVPGIDGLDAPLVDGLLTWLQEIQRAQVWMQQSHTPQEWVRRLQGLVERFFLAQTDDELRLIERLLAPLAQWRELCDLARMDEPVPLAVVREHWLSELGQAPMHRRFFGGGVQFATLMPMRTIPFRVVCLLGMNDADYPRRQTPRDFDLMTLDAQWRAGDRSRREDDRYLFLEAVLAARDKLYISWQAKRTTDHEPLPPSVLVAQLRDYLARGWTPVREPTLHPLQPFSPRYFEAGGGFTTYAQDWQAATTTHAVPDPTHSDGTKPPAVIAEHFIAERLNTERPVTQRPSIVTAHQLLRLLRQSVDVYWQDRLQVRFDPPQVQAPQDEPFGLEGLEAYLLGQQLASWPDDHTAEQRLHLGGDLALGGFGQLQAQQLLAQRQTLHERWHSVADHWPHPLPAQSLTLPCDGLPTLQASWADQPHPLWRLNTARTHAVQVQWRSGAVLQGPDKERQPRLDTLYALWLNHLLACASGLPTTSHLVGLDGVLSLRGLSADQARAHLRTLVEAWVQAWQVPLLLPRQTACHWLLAMHAGDTDQTDEATTIALDTLTTELTRHTGLQRVVTDVDAVLNTITEWAPRIYGPMLAHVTHAAHPVTDTEAA
jgi:exodeoxyribonuclease V gamma subunit